MRSDEELLKLIPPLGNLTEEERIRLVIDVLGECTPEEARRLIFLTVQPMQDSPEVQQMRRAHIQNFQDKSPLN